MYVLVKCVGNDICLACKSEDREEICRRMKDDFNNDLNYFLDEDELADMNYDEGSNEFVGHSAMISFLNGNAWAQLDDYYMWSIFDLNEVVEFPGGVDSE